MLNRVWSFDSLSSVLQFPDWGKGKKWDITERSLLHSLGSTLSCISGTVRVKQFRLPLVTAIHNLKITVSRQRPTKGRLLIRYGGRRKWVLGIYPRMYHTPLLRSCLYYRVQTVSRTSPSGWRSYVLFCFCLAFRSAGGMDEVDSTRSLSLSRISWTCSSSLVYVGMYLYLCSVAKSVRCFSRLADLAFFLWSSLLARGCPVWSFFSRERDHVCLLRQGRYQPAIFGRESV